MQGNRVVTLLAALGLWATVANAQAVTQTRTPPAATPAGLAAIGRLQVAAADERASDDERLRATAFEQLAAGLDHSEWPVRLRAVELLAAARDRERAIDRLVAAAARIGDDMQKRLRELPPAGKPPKPPAPGEDPFAGLQKTLEQPREQLALAKRALDELDGAMALVEAYRREFLAMPEAPRRRGLLSLHHGFPGYDPRLLSPLLAVWDADVIVALGDMHTATSASATQAKEALTKARRQKPQSNPWPDKHRDAWLAREQGRIRGEVEKLQAQFDERERSLAEFEDVVSRFAAEHELPAAPKGAASAEWRRWAAAARKVVAERTPK